MENKLTWTMYVTSDSVGFFKLCYKTCQLSSLFCSLQKTRDLDGSLVLQKRARKYEQTNWNWSF